MWVVAKTSRSLACSTSPHDGSGGRLGVPPAHRRQGRLGRARPAGLLLDRGLDGGQRLGRGPLQGPQPVEVLALGVQPGVRLRAAAQDLVQHGPPGRVVLGERVVELLPQPERGRQLLLGEGDRLGEGADGLLAELGGRETEFLLAGADGVVGGDQRLPGLSVELVEGRRRGLPRRAPALPALRRGAGLGAPAVAW